MRRKNRKSWVLEICIHVNYVLKEGYRLKSQIMALIVMVLKRHQKSKIEGIGN
jgi:hypothetical protein